MTVTIQGLKHTEILRDRTDLRFTGRTLRLVSEFGGELKLELSARQLVSLAALLDEAKNTLVYKDHQWVNADQIPAAPSLLGDNLVTERTALLSMELRMHVYNKLTEGTRLSKESAAAVAQHVMTEFAGVTLAEEMKRMGISKVPNA